MSGYSPIGNLIRGTNPGRGKRASLKKITGSLLAESRSVALKAAAAIDPVALPHAGVLFVYL
jgi:hypothetical protein